MGLSDNQRNELVAKAKFLIGKASLIDYEAVRPMLTRGESWDQIVSKLDNGGRIAMDCSEAVTELYRWCGLKDPNGLGFDGFGNSGQMWHHLAHRYTDPGDAHPGALGVYGPEGDEHVVMVIEHDAHNPLLFSHGSEIGPLAITLHNEAGAHQGQPFTFLDVSSLG